MEDRQVSAGAPHHQRRFGVVSFFAISHCCEFAWQACHLCGVLTADCCVLALLPRS